MMKFGAKIFGFLILVILGLFYLSGHSVPNHHYRNTLNSFNNLIDQGKGIDIGIYGSSHAYCSYNPRTIDGFTKTRSFNFGNDAQRLIVTKFVLAETLKEYSPKLVVLDVYPASIADPEGPKQLSFQRSSFNYFDISIGKFKSAFEVFPSHNALEIIFPVIRRKNFIPKFYDKKRYSHPSSAKAEEYRGFVGYNLEMEEEVRVSEKSMTLLKEKIASNGNKGFFQFSDREAENLREFVSLAKSNKSSILLVVAPYYSAFNPDNDYYSDYHISMKKFCLSQNINFLDLNLEWHNIGLKNSDFKDKGHLSLAGAAKVSGYLGKYINQNYDLPSRENDPGWIAEQPQDLDSYLDSDFNKQKTLVNFELSKDFKIKSFSIAEVNEGKNIVLELDNMVTDSILKKYKLGLHTYVNNKDLVNLMAYSKAKARKYDAWDFDPVLYEKGGKKYIIKPISTSIKSFAKVRLFLYDRDGYKGLIGESLEISDVNIK